MRRLPKLLLAAAAASALAACSNDTSLTAPSPDALQAAEQLTHFADSISATDNAFASTVRGLADVVRRSGAVATVSISIDGRPHDFSAVANESILLIPCTATASSGDQSSAMCGDVPLRRRSLVAWEPGTRRLLALTTLDESGPIGRELSTAERPAAARLQLFTGDGHQWWGVSGTQSNAMTLGSSCSSVTTQYGDKTVIMTCHHAEFRWAFSATLEVPSSATIASTTAEQHTVTLPESSVHGAQWAVIVATRPAPPTEPPPASPLAAVLHLSIDTTVHLTFTVKNRTDARVDLKFATSKTHDFIIADRSGATLWRWSDGKRFISSTTLMSIAAHDSIVFTDQWAPTVHGDLIAGALLTSQTQNVAARAAFTVP